MNPLANVALQWNGQVRDEKFKCSPLTSHFLHSTYIYTIMEFVQQDSHIVVFSPFSKKKKHKKQKTKHSRLNRGFI